MSSVNRTAFAIVITHELRTVLHFMSLNQTEQRVFDYLQAQPDEKRHWHDKVVGLSARARDPHVAALELEAELWRYLEERSAVASPFREVAQREGLRRISLRNLAEYLLRLWAPVKVKPRSETDAPWRPYA
jgi:hypothetical protein